MNRARELRCRRMMIGDLEAVMAIEEGAYPDCWSRQAFLNYLHDPYCVSNVIELNQRVCGFFILALGRHGAHLLNIAVAGERRRQGLGLLGLSNAEHLARRHSMDEMWLEVRESNLPAQLMYRKAGYRAERVLRGYYKNEDAYLMRKLLNRAAGAEAAGA